MESNSNRSIATSLNIYMEVFLFCLSYYFRFTVNISIRPYFFVGCDLRPLRDGMPTLSSWIPSNCPQISLCNLLGVFLRDMLQGIVSPLTAPASSRLVPSYPGTILVLCKSQGTLKLSESDLFSTPADLMLFFGTMSLWWYDLSGMQL